MAFVAGPRQVGKTTLAKHLLSLVAADSFYFNWDIESHRKAIIKNPEEFWQVSGLVSSKGKQRIGLDEIHKYPRWKRFLKGLYDARGRDLEIIVTGSGRLDIYQRGGDSLFGRNIFHPCLPLSGIHLGNQIGDSTLWMGARPRAPTIFKLILGQSWPVPAFLSSVPAGFPS